ncbi:MAG TPA: DUF4287 domain-containing protein [Caulobacteraceae bacterium]|jgi:hypothetical protein|nr:DUF4287 domain-containing protein [Caulobacteraceae bacterium]
MSFQAYLDNIQAKTGKRPQDIASLVRERGLSKPGEIVAWVKEEFGLGHGHSMAIVSLVRSEGRPTRSADDKVAAYFSGPKAGWRSVHDRLAQEAMRFGPDVAVAPGATYLSLTKSGRKFAIVQAVGERLDLGMKIKDAAVAGRLEAAGSWNAMVTHRVRIRNEAELDDEVLGWLRQAYAKA